MCKRLFNWLREPWPLHLLPLFIFIHIALRKLAPYNVEDVDKYCSGLFQIIGGVIVLWVLNSNMGIVSRTTIFNSFKTWLKSFPLFQQTTTLHVASPMHITASLNGHAKVTPVFHNIDERVDHLFEELERIETKVDDTKSTLQKEITKTEQKLINMLNGIQQEVKEMSRKLKSAVVGGVKLEALGVLTILYGLIIPIM